MQIKDAIKQLREQEKRKFSQTFDLIINLTNIDLKKPENRIDEFLMLPVPFGRKVTVAAFVDKELVIEARKVCDFVIPKETFSSWVDQKRKILWKDQ